jgi:hypothetical protein
VIVVLSVRVTNHATRSSKSAVNRAPARANGTPSTGTPCSGQRSRLRLALTSSRHTPPSRDGARPTRDPDGSHDGAWSTNTSGSEGAGGATRPPRRPDRARSRPTEPIHRAGAADERMQSRRAWARPPARGPRTPRAYVPPRARLPKPPAAPHDQRRKGNQTLYPVFGLVPWIRPRTVRPSILGPDRQRGQRPPRARRPERAVLCLQRTLTRYPQTL